MFADDGSSKKSESSYIVSLFDDLSLVKIVQFKKNFSSLSLHLQYGPSFSRITFASITINKD